MEISKCIGQAVLKTEKSHTVQYMYHTFQKNPGKIFIFNHISKNVMYIDVCSTYIYIYIQLMFLPSTHVLSTKRTKLIIKIYCLCFIISPILLSKTTMTPQQPHLAAIHISTHLQPRKKS